MTYPPDWRTATLHYLGAIPGRYNMAALHYWAESEGMQPYANNPLAYTQHTNGSRPYPPSPTVQIYPNIDTAARLYAAAFRSPLYTAIGIALVADDGLRDIFEAINTSHWCLGCQSGTYPAVLYNAVRGGPVPAGLTPVTPMPATQHGTLSAPGADYSPTIRSTAARLRDHAHRLQSIRASVQHLLTIRLPKG